MSRSLLLRFFTSEYFNTSVAIDYLFKYPTDIGIQHYICAKLKNVDSKELQFYLPQLIHFIYVNPYEAAVKNLVVSFCKKSHHFALLASCHLNAYYMDLDEQSPKMPVVEDFINQLEKTFTPKNQNRKVPTNPHSSKDVPAALMGILSIFASFVNPEIALEIKEMSNIEQNKFPRETSTYNLESFKDETMYEKSKFSNSVPLSPVLKPKSKNLLRMETPSLQNLRKGNAFSSTNYELSNNKDITALNLEFTATSPVSDIIPKNHDFFTEIQFLLVLVAISNRLCLIPKHLRQNSLEAELILLNHNLPADLCIPLWCAADSGNIGEHHKIVKISPKDAVVLNSAERAPFLIFVEVLNKHKGIHIEKFNEYSNEENLEASFEETEYIETNTSNSKNPNIKPKLKDDKDEFSESMKTAAILLTQLSTEQDTESKKTIRKKIIEEMTALEEKRMSKMEQLGVNCGAAGEVNDSQSISDSIKLKDDPSAAVFKENWEAKEQRIRDASIYGKNENWELLPIIIKTGADLRQEQFALQLIGEIKRIWERKKIDIFVHCFNIIVISNDCGLVEMIKNTISVHSLKKDAYKMFNTKTGTKPTYSLYNYFIDKFGKAGTVEFVKAQHNFMKSLAGYSIVTYVLQLKDRHNGNILIDEQGHLVHIDFGFILSNSPGSVGFESAPFKLTQEYIDILGGTESQIYNEFRALMIRGLFELRNNCDSLVALIEIMQRESKLPCFSAGASVIPQLKQRLKLELTKAEFMKLVDHLIMSSCFNVFTRLYDSFQYYSNGIL